MTDSTSIADARQEADVSRATIQQIPIGALCPNDYNPNRMTDDEFAEMVVEVRHVGRLPKPVIVRPNGDGYVIVDGEHGWRAAKEVGLAEIPCEVIEVDDFEAMRQTYKRNQHGTHNPLLLGQMFQQMIAERELSRRGLADEIGVSEGTIRNGLEYVQANEVRNSCAADEEPTEVRNSYAVEVAALSLRQVKTFNQLPAKVANMWLDAGADQESLVFPIGCYTIWAAGGLAEFLKPVWSKSSFEKAMKQLRDWHLWEDGWVVGGITREFLRPYTQHFFRGAWHVRTDLLMDFALEEIVDRQTAEFLLTPEEFEECLEVVRKERSSAGDFKKLLRLKVAKKHGRHPESRHHVQRDLMQLDIDKEAPDYIKESQLSIYEKHALLYEYKSLDRDDPVPRDLREQVLRDLAKMKGIPRQRKQRMSEAIREAIGKALHQREQKQRWQEWIDSKDEADLAAEIAAEFWEEGEGRDCLEKKLATFAKTELLALREIAHGKEMLREWTGRLNAMLGGGRR